jgi:hypothetical protein
LLLILAASGAALVAPLIAIGFDLRVFSREATTAAARTQLWLVLVALEAAAWILIVAWMAKVIRRLRTVTAAPMRVIFGQAVLPVLILSLPPVLLTYAGRGSSQVPPMTIPPYSIRNMPIVGSAGIIVAMLCVFAMYWARFAIRECTSKGELGSRIQALIELHTHARASLLSASTTLAARGETGCFHAATEID